MDVGLFGHSAVVFQVFMFFSCFLNVILTVCVAVFFQWHFIDLVSWIAASLFNKLTYLLTIISFILKQRWGYSCKAHCYAPVTSLTLLYWQWKCFRMTIYDMQIPVSNYSVEDYCLRLCRRKLQPFSKLLWLSFHNFFQDTHSTSELSGLQKIKVIHSKTLVAWHSGRTSVSGRRTFPVLRSTCSWWVTIRYEMLF